MARRLLLALGLLLCPGCYTPPPGLEDSEIITMEHVREGDASIFYRKSDVPRERAAALAPEVEGVRVEVGTILGVTPPRAQLVVYEPSGPPGAAGLLVDRVLCLYLEREHTIRFRYPLPDDDPLARAQLLGTVGHEVAEATLLGAVESVDPYLRWMHDGVAELVEHEVQRRRDPEASRLLLQRTVRFVTERRARGVEWVDLTRWRQIVEYVIRANRLLRRLGDDEGQLSLVDAQRSLARVRRAAAVPPTADEPPGLRTGLVELQAVLQAAAQRQRLPWREGEGRTDDPDALDYLFYNASFAVWVHLERASPGTLQRFLAALVARRAADPVLTAAEATSLLREATGDVALPPLERLPLSWVEEVLHAEERRLER